MKKYLLVGLLAISNYCLAEDEETAMKVISVLLGNDDVLDQLPLDDLNENIDLLMEDSQKGKIYTDQKTRSKLRQISDLFIDCERDTIGNIVYVKLIRLVHTESGYSVRTIAQLDKSYCI